MKTIKALSQVNELEIRNQFRNASETESLEQNKSTVEIWIEAKNQK